MKKKQFLIGLVVILSILVTGYWYFFRPQPFPSVQASFIVPVIREYGVHTPDGVLAPDGNSIWIGLVSSIDVRTGAWSSIKIVDAPLGLTLAHIFLDISPNGRYLTASAGSSFGFSNYLVDVEQKNYQEGIYLCESWSGDSTRCLEAIFSRLVEMPANQVVEDWSRTVDFRKSSEVSGDYIFLWDRKQRIPVAEIYPCPSENDDQATAYCLVSLSAGDNVFRKYTSSQPPVILPIFEIALSQKVASYTFDPTGKYVLFAVWENKGEYTSGDYDTSTVVDTVLVLVDWRTKKSREIFRISEIDPEHVVVSRGASALEWSSDGSTILVYRNYAPAIVLKLKYP